MSFKSMRCLSPHRNYSIQVIEGREKIVVDARGYATTVELSKPFLANFSPSGLTEYEELACYERFDFSGLPEGVNPLTTIGVWDVETACMAFPKDRRQELYVQVCQRMRDLSERFPSEFIVVEPPDAERPWPKYDDFTSEDVIKFQEVLGVEPDLIRLYELENQGRHEIILAMLQKSDPRAAERFAKGLGPEDEEDAPGTKAREEQDVSKLQKLLSEVDPPEERVIVDA